MLLLSYMVLYGFVKKGVTTAKATAKHTKK